MCNYFSCIGVRFKIYDTSDKKKVESFLERCEECCHKKENVPLHKKETYQQVRLKNSDLYWKKKVLTK